MAFSWKTAKSILLALLLVFLVITAGVFWWSFLTGRSRSASPEAVFPALREEERTSIREHLRQWRDEEVAKERKKWEAEHGRKLTKDQFVEQILPK